MRWLSLGLAVLLSGCVGEVGLLDAAPSVVPERDGGALADDAGLDAGAPDAAVADAGAPDAGAADAGSVAHVVVAAGWGGRRVRSCDDGQTWSADVQVAPQSDDDWHRPYTPKSLSFGAGRFVFLTGWGADSSVHVSTNGTTWTTTTLTTTYGGVGFADGRFVLVGNRNIAGASANASDWSVDQATAAPAYDRACAAFDGIWAAGADGEVQVRRPGGAWQAVTCTGTRHTSIGFTGGFAAGNGRLVSLGDDGDVCVIDAATGQYTGAATLGVAAAGPVVFDGRQFLTATGARLLRSSDGVSWTTQMLPQQVRFELVTRTSTGRLVGVATDGTRAWFSDDDGATWIAATFPAGNGLLYVASGDIETCP